MDGFYILDDERVRQFLIVGEDEALLIDTGFEDSHVYQAVRSITDLPVQVLMTHGDRDHAGGLKDFPCPLFLYSITFSPQSPSVF